MAHLTKNKIEIEKNEANQSKTAKIGACQE